MNTLVFLIPLFPICAFLILLALPKKWRNRLMYIAPVAMICSALIALATLIVNSDGGAPLEPFYHWVYKIGSVGGTSLAMSFSIDSLSAVMLVMVTIIGACVQVYSLSYMKDDERRGWYFTVMSLFTSAMLLLVMSGDLLLIFAMWEVMGVCSYLLIGFWYRELAPRQASQKAFLVTRAADGGFFIALATIFAASGTFKIDQILASAPSWPAWVVVVASLGLLWAAMGKSAQFPLNVWLPDAMAGPTPGSALIHAATMVAAGVFMIARMLPMFMLTPWIMALMCWIGIVTAVFGAAIACFQDDIKGVLAFSTISQLGAMFIALGAGSAVIALYHLTTHAFFKSLLFLSAGIIIHAMHTQDVGKMGGLAKRMPWTMAVYGIGAFALAGLFPLSGFFSKDEIFALLLHEHHYLRFALACVMGILTSLYVVKTFLRVFFGEEKTKGAHDGSLLVMIPVTILATITLLGGLGTVAFAEYVGYEGHWPSLEMMAISTGLVVVGSMLGYLAYRGLFDRYKATLNPIGRAFYNRLYEDSAYEYGIIKPFFWLTEVLWAFDRVIVDGIVNGAVRVYHLLTRGGNRLDRIIDTVPDGVATLYRHGTVAGNRIDHGIDRIVDGVTALFVGTTRFSQWFERTVIEGSTRLIERISHGLARGFRALQNGNTHTYQRIALGSVIVLLFVVVVLKGL